MSKHHTRLRGWSSFRRRLLNERGWRCSECGKAGALEIHHKRRLHEGGDPFDESNCAILCSGCHIAVHRPPPDPAREAWKKLVGEVMG